MKNGSIIRQTMLKDYYAILGINYPSDEKEIKFAYRKQAFKWHPDRNIGRSTEEQMKDINEAYTILSNPISRGKYEKEYQIFKQGQKVKEEECTSSTVHSPNNNFYDSNEEFHYTKWQYDYDVKDWSLREDIKNARESAERYIKDFLASLKNDSKVAIKGAWDEVFSYIIAGVIMIILVFFIQTCS